MKYVRQKIAFFIQSEAAKDGVRACVDSSEVIRDPVRRDLAVCVGRQYDAVLNSLLPKPRFGKIHRSASTIAGMRFLTLPGMQALLDFPPDMARVPTEPNRLSKSPLSEPHLPSSISNTASNFGVQPVLLH